MNDFTILHLSDLHISSSSRNLSKLMENLLIDIEKEMSLSENILIVVTGDIINQANYKNREAAIEFFRRLKKILKAKVCHIYIVPGNHDKMRNYMDKQIVQGYVEEDDKFYSDIWKYFKMGFDEYTKMVGEIYSIFYPHGMAKKRVFKDTFGVQIDKVNGKTICILQLNTAWSSTGKEDERNLRFGSFQMKKLKESYEKKKDYLRGQKIDITIAIAHHPLGWLRGRDEDILQAEMLSANGISTDIYICGHVHNRDVINWQNNRHSLTTLVSGIGWPDGNETHPEAHSYSSYVFNLDINSIDVYVRSSNDALKFEPDFRIYTQERNKRDNKIIMPIDSCKTQAYFNLSTVQGRSAKGCYITDKIIDYFEKTVRIFEGVKIDVGERLFFIKYDAFETLRPLKIKKTKLDKLESFWFKGALESEDGNERKILANNKNLLYMHFSAYLQYLCISLYNNIKRYLPDSRVRVHFRYLNLKEDKYYQSCIYGMNFERYTMRPIQWGELIEKAFVVGHPLIASVNHTSCPKSFQFNENKSSGEIKWEDFITVIPDIKQNCFEKINRKLGKVEKRRPIFTFGVTVYREEDRKLLYIFDYFRIDKMIGELFNNFLYYMPIDLMQYVEDLDRKRGSEN